MSQKRRKKAQFFIITAVILVLTFSALFAKLSDMKTQFPKQDVSLVTAYLSYTNSYNNAIKNAYDAKAANRNVDQINNDQRDLFIKKSYDLKYSGEFGFFDGFAEKRYTIMTANANANIVNDALEIDYSAIDGTVDLTYSNLNLDANEFDILDIIIKTDDPVDVTITNPVNGGELATQKTKEYKLFTNTTHLGGTLNTITITFTSSADTNTTIDYIGLRTNRIMEVSSSKISMRRED